MITSGLEFVPSAIISCIIDCAPMVSVVVIIALGNLWLCWRTRTVRQFREWSQSLYQTAFRFPSPRPSPTGRGNSRQPVRLFERFVGKTRRGVAQKGSGE